MLRHGVSEVKGEQCDREEMGAGASEWGAREARGGCGRKLNYYSLTSFNNSRTFTSQTSCRESLDRIVDFLPAR